eukprot:scaffold21979_cov66-Phaeocystis_antarctica.AAC.4
MARRRIAACMVVGDTSGHTGRQWSALVAVGWPEARWRQASGRCSRGRLVSCRQRLADSESNFGDSVLPASPEANRLHALLLEQTGRGGPGHGPAHYPAARRGLGWRWRLRLCFQCSRVCRCGSSAPCARWSCQERAKLKSASRSVGAALGCCARLLRSAAALGCCT